jgi:signal transduction histidine kinase
MSRTGWPESDFPGVPAGQDGRSADKPEGTGLGLALAKKFVDMHGGKLWLENEAGRGSRFFFTLPMARD